MCIESFLSYLPFSKKDLHLFPKTVLPKSLETFTALTFAGASVFRTTLATPFSTHRPVCLSVVFIYLQGKPCGIFSLGLIRRVPSLCEIKCLCLSISPQCERSHQKDDIGVSINYFLQKKMKYFLEEGFFVVIVLYCFVLFSGL